MKTVNYLAVISVPDDVPAPDVKAYVNDALPWYSDIHILDVDTIEAFIDNAAESLLSSDMFGGK
jgi:hypothetical protein